MMADEPKVSRRGLFAWLGAGSVAAAARVLPSAEAVAPRVPQIWETSWIAGRKFFWDGVQWVKTYSNEYLVK
jgi:hypothetical protein